MGGRSATKHMEDRKPWKIMEDLYIMNVLMNGYDVVHMEIDDTFKIHGTGHKSILI